MTRFEPGGVIHAPFPHIERAVVVRRPALILAVRDTGETSIGPLAWVLMITSAARPAWVGDVAIPDAETLGLIIPSKVRTAKIATIAAKDAVVLGRMDAAAWAEVRRLVAGAMPAA